MKKETSHSSRFVFRMSMALALAAGALMVVPATAGAWGRRGGKGMHRGGKGGKGVGKLMRGDLKQLKQHLGLSATQVNQIKQLRRANKGKLVNVRLKMARLNAKMRVEWLAAKPSAWKLKKLHQRKLQLRNKMANHRFNIRLRVSQILTPSQRMKLKRRGRFGRRFALGGKGRRGPRGRHGRFGRRGRF